MDGGAVLHPRGPLPPSVYWRRRFTLFCAAVAVLALVVGAYSCGTGGNPAAGTPTSSRSAAAKQTSKAATSAKATPTPTAKQSPAKTSGSATKSATPSKSATPTAKAAACKPDSLEVEAKPDKLSYPAGARPVLTLSVTNAGTKACTQDLGQAARELRITSGNDRIWSSDDCTEGGDPEPVVLKPGDTKDFSVTWSRKWSAKGCPTGAKDATPGTYRVIGRIGTVESGAEAFLLN